MVLSIVLIMCKYHICFKWNMWTMNHRAVGYFSFFQMYDSVRNMLSICDVSRRGHANQQAWTLVVFSRNIHRTPSIEHTTKLCVVSLLLIPGTLYSIQCIAFLVRIIRFTSKDLTSMWMRLFDFNFNFFNSVTYLVITFLINITNVLGSFVFRINSFLGFTKKLWFMYP